MDAAGKKAYSILAGVTLFIIAGGMVFYHFVEDFGWIDAYYYCVVTLTTVGYGDFVPKTELGKLFTTLYLFIGIGIITAFISTSVKRRAAKIHQRRHRDEIAKE